MQVVGYIQDRGTYIDAGQSMGYSSRVRQVHQHGTTAKHGIKTFSKSCLSLYIQLATARPGVHTISHSHASSKVCTYQLEAHGTDQVIDHLHLAKGFYASHAKPAQLFYFSCEWLQAENPGRPPGGEWGRMQRQACCCY